MTDDRASMGELTRVHEAIRHYVEEARKAVSDVAAMSALCSGKLDERQCKSVGDSQFNLEQSLQYLRQGLEDHHAREERLLAPLIGKPLARSLDKECSQINSLFQEAEGILKDTSLSGMRPEELASTMEKANRVTAGLAALIDQHSRNIDVLLQMLRNSS